MSRVDLLAGLYQHQATELEYLLGSNGHRLLFWEQGCGKGVLAARLGWALDGPKLYLCPASCKVQVARELRRWGAPGVVVQVLVGRNAMVDPAADWVVINYDLLLADAVLDPLIARRWALLIVDESHLCRNPSAKRTKLVFGVAPCLAERAARVVCLTGTPVVNSPLDLFPAVNRLVPRALAAPGPGATLRRMQRGVFEQTYCVFRSVRIGGGREVRVPAGAQNTEELRARLAPYVSRLRRADVLDLPALRVDAFALAVAPSDALTAALEQSPSQLLERLRQATTLEARAAILAEYDQVALATARRLLGIAKAPAAAGHLAERLDDGEDRVIGFFHHREVSDALIEGLRDAGSIAGVIRGDTPAATRTRLIDAFVAGKLPVLLLQSQSGSLGLNLQTCRYAAIVEPDWTDATTQQSIARLYRAGQSRDVTIEFLLIPDSLDEHIAAVAHGKARIAAELIETSAMETA
jgi:SNF2 family DNA or RNA helicase